MSQSPSTFPNHDDKSLRLLEEVSQESRIVDSELFIRQAFERSLHEGYALLFRRYYRMLCNHAVRFVQSKEQAEDLVCEVFSSIWKGQFHRHITTSFRAYLFRALRNRIYNHLRDELVYQRPSQDVLVDITQEEDPLQILQFTELYQRVQTVVEGLPPQCQRVFLMSRFENKKHKEIANELSISVKAVEMHITKALRQLRIALFSVSLLAIMVDLLV